MSDSERQILEALDAAVQSAAAVIGPIIKAVDQKLTASPDEVLAWESIPLDRYNVPLPPSIRSSWVFVLRAKVVTGAERHPNSHQRMMSYRGNGDFQTKPGESWLSHHLASEPSLPLDRRWISIPPNVWHQGVVGDEHWAVVSFHTVLPNELIEERPAVEATGANRQRRYVPADGSPGSRARVSPPRNTP